MSECLLVWKLFNIQHFDRFQTFFATTRNNIQQSVHTEATYNVGSCSPTMLCPLARGFSYFPLPLKQSVCESSDVDLCGDKGICLPDYSKDSFTCKCDKGYTGTRCGKLQTSHPLDLFHLGGLKTKDSNHLCIKCDLKLFIYLLASYYSEVVFYSFLY